MIVVTKKFEVFSCRSPQGNCFFLPLAARKPKLVPSVTHLERTTLANRLPASRNYKRPCSRPLIQRCLKISSGCACAVPAGVPAETLACDV